MQEAVEKCCCDHGVAEGLARGIWNCHMFVWADMRCELLNLVHYVSADRRFAGCHLDSSPGLAVQIFPEVIPAGAGPPGGRDTCWGPRQP